VKRSTAAGHLVEMANVADDRLRGAEPSAVDLADQLGVELAASDGHLRRVLATYWDPGWRRLQKDRTPPPRTSSGGRAQATVEITDALADLGR
jgi:hypothetical protein